MAEWLARIPAADDVHRLNGRPVDAGDVAQVGGVGVAVGEDGIRARVHVGHPCGFGAEHVGDGTIDAAVAAEQAAVFHAAAP